MEMPTLCLYVVRCCGLLTLLPPAAGAVTQIPARPNIVLLMADDQGWGETGYDGHLMRKVHAEGNPFLAVIWFGSPHSPYSGFPEDVALYRDVPKEEMRLRFAEITAMDRVIGSLRNTLRRRGLADGTRVWFNSAPTAWQLPVERSLAGRDC